MSNPLPPFSNQTFTPAPQPAAPIPLDYQRPVAPVRRGLGGFKLFRLFGIQVYLHWSWFVVAAIELQSRANAYSTQVWNIAEYLALFVIVTMHEFGHALACRSVGGKADRIVLWPLGGVAFVNPPPRPGALLWSIVAGPLVNVVLIPITYALYVFPPIGGADGSHFFKMLMFINLLLLIFNILPIYPLDGGQILRSLLWFIVGRARSLTIAAGIGLLGAAGVLILALYSHDTWLIILAAFGGVQCWAGFGQARAIKAADAAARHDDFACPRCGAHPPAAPLWRCSRCGFHHDTFASGLTCPQCGLPHQNTACPACGQSSPSAQWHLFDLETHPAAPAPPLGDFPNRSQF
ncbi:MAG TPA: site-2 protease family protein [Tepidisphaeraceae bacterium]